MKDEIDEALETEWSDACGQIPTVAAIVAQLGDRWPKLRQKLQRSTRELLDVLTEVQAVAPNANYYLECNHLILMSGPSHEEPSQSPQRHREIWSRTLPGFDGGAW